MKLLLFLPRYKEEKWPVVTPIVNKEGDYVEFPLNGVRNKGQRIFLVGTQTRIFHLHRHRNSPGTKERAAMNGTPIGSCFTEKPLVRFFCKCGLTLTVPENGMSSDELSEYFHNVPNPIPG